MFIDKPTTKNCIRPDAQSSAVRCQRWLIPSPDKALYGMPVLSEESGKNLTEIYPSFPRIFFDYIC